eukprot:RCo055461
MRALAASSFSPNLNIVYNQIGSAGIEALAASTCFPNLTWLYAGGSHLRDAGMQALAASSSLTSLTFLDLSDSCESQSLLGLPFFSKLTSLNLRGNMISAEGAVALAASSFFPPTLG